MRARYLFGALFLALGPTEASGQKAAPTTSQKPIDTTVCRILGNPRVFNNKLVRVRGYLLVNFESSVLVEEGCQRDGIWFAFANGSGPPGLWVMVNGQGRPGGRAPNGKRTPPIPVRLIRDSNYEAFIHHLEISAKGESCTDEEPSPLVVPDCHTYRVSATLTGRIDSISSKVHAARKKRYPQQGTDGRGFGHMGMFEAQLVVQSVENVVAVEN